MKANLLIAFACSLFFINSAIAQKKKPYAVKVYLTDHKQERGILQSVDEKGITILTRSKASKFVDLSQIDVVKLRPKKAASRGVVIGLLTGLAAGATATTLFKPDDKLETTIGVVGTAGLTFAGMAIGGSIGSRSRETIRIGGSSEKFGGSLSKLKGFAINQ